MSSPPIVLTTDFGTSDPYAGVMKGVILGLNPDATIVDLTHQIQPQNILQGAFVLGASHRYFPQGAIHVAVVDPGVGTGRRAILVDTPTARFLAPDNGLLSYVLREYLDDPPGEPGRVRLPASVTAHQLTEPMYWLDPVSPTFHGRDIFAPVAAHLSLGVAASGLGPAIDDLVWLPAPRPSRQGDRLAGQVVYADHFGNLVTNIAAHDLADSNSVQVEIKGQRITGLSQTFQSPENPGD
ncbi:MAG: SAM-dependent chlorinase/fluorinase, partial [Chloroflexi bacterium]|nr:SAM-dependent chlorinase/fluorinase [Chloroflexota bacterium]